MITPWKESYHQPRQHIKIKPVNLFVAGFIGEPPMNFVRATVHGGCIEIAGQKLDLSRKLGDKAASYENKDEIIWSS